MPGGADTAAGAESEPAVAARSGLLTVAAAAGSPHAVRTLARALACEAAGTLGVEHCLVLALRGGWLVPLAGAGPRAAPTGSPVRLSQLAAAAQALRERRPVLAKAGHLSVGCCALPGTGTVLLAPLLWKRRCLGFLLFGADGRDLTEAEASLGAAVAPPIARVLRIVSAGRRATARLRAARMLLRVSRSLGSSLDLREVMERVAREAARAVRADSTGIYVLAESGHSLELVAAHHTREELLGVRAVPLDAVHSLNGAPTWNHDPARQQEAFWKAPAASRLLAPLRAGDELVGLLVCAWWARPRNTSRHAGRLIQAMAAQAAVALANARLYARAEARAVDRERTRLDALVHDTLSQTLFSLGLKVELALGMAREPSRLRATLEAVKRDAKALSRQVQQVLASAPEPARAEAPAPERLIRVIQEFRELTGVPVVLIEAGPAPRLGPRQLDVLIMIVQGGLASLAQGTRGARAEIRLDATTEGIVRFTVSGTGGRSTELGELDFPPTGIVARISTLGGRIDVIRSGGNGFCVSGALPLIGEGDGEDPDRGR